MDGRRKNTATPKVRRTADMTFKQLCAAMVKAFGSRASHRPDDAQTRALHARAVKWGDFPLTDHGCVLPAVAFGVGFLGTDAYVLNGNGRYHRAEVV